MSRRRAALAVSVFTLLTLSVIAVVTPVRAQTEVDDARQEAERAADAADTAYEIVDAAVTERAEIEDRLFATLDRYQANAQLLAEFSASLEQLNDTLAIAEARQESTRDSFEAQAVAAYMNAVGTAGVLVIDSATIETAMVTQETLGRTSRATLESLDGYLAFRTEVDSLRANTLQQAQETETVQADLDADAAELDQLFAAANADVATAYRAAVAAQADLARANRRLSAAEAAATTTTTASPLRRPSGPPPAPPLQRPRPPLRRRRPPHLSPPPRPRPPAGRRFRSTRRRRAGGPCSRSISHPISYSMRW